MQWTSRIIAAVGLVVVAWVLLTALPAVVHGQWAYPALLVLTVLASATCAVAAPASTSGAEPVAAGRVDRPVRRGCRLARGHRVAPPVRRRAAGVRCDGVRRGGDGRGDVQPGRPRARWHARSDDRGLLPAGGQGRRPGVCRDAAPTGGVGIPRRDRQAAAGHRLPLARRVRRRSVRLPPYSPLGAGRAQPRRDRGSDAGRRPRRRRHRTAREVCSCTRRTRPATSASRCTAEVPERVGINDGLATPADIEASAPNLPEGSAFVTVEGAVHSFFGDYGPQPGDGQPTISHDEARTQISNASRRVRRRGFRPVSDGVIARGQ